MVKGFHGSDLHCVGRSSLPVVLQAQCCPQYLQQYVEQQVWSLLYLLELG